MSRTLIVATLLAFGALTASAAWLDGLAGISASIVRSHGSAQMFADLVIALTLIMVWMWRDAKTRGRTIWPGIAATLVAGSFGPLLYLLTRKSSRGLA